MSALWFRDAKLKAVLPLILAFKSAPFSSKAFTISAWPRDAAVSRAVHPLAVAFTSAPFSNKALTISTWPSAASSRGVHP